MSIQIPPLKKTYKGQTALDLPEFEIDKGSIVAVCGQNGSGKSTMGKLLAGVIKDDQKRIINPGISVGYMTQNAFAFNLSVMNNLLLNSDESMSKSDCKERAFSLLEFIGIETLKDKNAKKLSGGETEKMALCRLLMKKYDMIILDEPTAAMDAASVPLAEKLILNYHERTGATIILITHSLEQAKRLANEIITIEKK